jgi:site-specific recombinase XerD
VVQQLLGHASWSTTMDLYTHRVERLQRDASARIEGVVFGVPTENS